MQALIRMPPVAIRRQLFLNRCFDFITEKNGKKHVKQELALQYLTDHDTTELGYGGAAGGAKSWTGCTWIAFLAECYPGVRLFIGREELKRLRESTLITFYKVCKEYGITAWHYNGQDHNIQFDNGSVVDLLDLKFLPSDPLYERYGSTEYTCGFIDEGGEINFTAFDVLKSRVGRHKNDEYKIKRKILVTFNPKKNFVDSYFYRPAVKGLLPPHRKYIPALIKDNPHGQSDYENALRSLTSKVAIERLLNGNFDYDDDPATLCDYDAIMDLFTCEAPDMTYSKAISSDLAMQGRDRFLVGYWDSLVCSIEVDKPKAKGKEIETDIRNVMKRRRVGHSQTIVDSDGLGAYLESYLTGIKEFHAGGQAVNKDEFANLKSECGYKLAEVVNKRQMKIICSPEQQERIIEELGVLKTADVDRDETRKRIISKEKMKELLQRSPDYLDMLLMRMAFLVQPVKKWIY